jgi:hypothetical protein
MSQALQTASGTMAVEISARLSAGLQLNRAETNRLLNTLENLNSSVAGCEIMQAQLRAVLARKDWLVISIEANAATVRTLGVNIGIVALKPQPIKSRLSPMQKYQRQHGLGRRI